MVFSSIVFLYIFLPLMLLLYFIVPSKLKNAIMILASLVFFAWGEIRYIFIMLVLAVMDFICGKQITKYQNNKKKKIIFLMINVVVNLGILFFFKYADFIITNINNLTGLSIPLLNIPLPIGVSFNTFQSLSYIIDVYRGTVKCEKSFYNYLTYTTLFPQIIAGPIVRYETVDEELETKNISMDNFSAGMKRFIIGLGKKVLIANSVGALWNTIETGNYSELSMLFAWMGIIAFALQIYFDFSGYSDMAIGLAQIFGMKFDENFNYPYISKSISEFWQRWHISLATWFKQYLYIPLGGNRVSPVRTYVNLFVVFLVTGIWHGASWTFVMWGVWNGVFICWEKYMGWHKDKPGETRLAGAAKHVYAMLAFLLGLVIFRSDNMAYAWGYLKQMFLIDLPATLPEADFGINNKFILMLVVGLVCSVPLFKNMIYVKYEHKVLRSIVNIWISLLFYWSTISLASSTYNPFIYFRF